MTFWLIMSFIAGTGIGWCLCSCLYILDEYLEVRRNQIKINASKRTTCDAFMSHRLVQDHHTGEIGWMSYTEWLEMKRKENHEKNKVGSKNS